MYIGMSETIPSSRSGQPWAQFYQHSNISGQATAPAGAGRTLFCGGGDSDTTTMVASATTNVSSSSSGPHHGSAAASSQLLNPDGRVSKPVRRRSRASRRTPTTLLNTDTSNFRAMVQQFTGGPTAPAASHHPPPPAANFNFGLGISRPQLVNPSTAVVMVPNSDLYHRLPLHIQQQQQQQLFQHHRGHGDVNFLQRLANSNSTRSTGEIDAPAAAGGGFASPPPHPPSTENNSSINYMF